VAWRAAARPGARQRRVKRAARCFKSIAIFVRPFWAAVCPLGKSEGSPSPDAPYTEASRRLYRLDPRSLAELDVWLATFQGSCDDKFDVRERHMNRKSRA
jgi:hypothetical protein